MELDYFRIVLSLLASVALGVAIIYFMSRYGIGRGRKAGSAKRIEVLELQALGNRTSLVAVSFAGNEVLMVVGPGFASVAVVRPIPPLPAATPATSNCHPPEGDAQAW
jgi:flagellar biogenesis protein FliO